MHGLMECKISTTVTIRNGLPGSVQIQYFWIGQALISTNLLKLGEQLSHQLTNYI